MKNNLQTEWPNKYKFSLKYMLRQINPKFFSCIPLHSLMMIMMLPAAESLQLHCWWRWLSKVFHPNSVIGVHLCAASAAVGVAAAASSLLPTLLPLLLLLGRCCSSALLPLLANPELFKVYMSQFLKKVQLPQTIRFTVCFLMHTLAVDGDADAAANAQWICCSRIVYFFFFLNIKRWNTN